MDCHIRQRVWHVEICSVMCFKWRAHVPFAVLKGTGETH
jgi:hypothetical protein